MPQNYSCKLDFDTSTTLEVYLLRNVTNVDDIRNNIIRGIWKCAAVKASLMMDPFQIAVAANKAVVSEKLNTMVTRTVFAEILFNLSLTKNITQSLSKFGIEKDCDLLLCFLKTPDMDCSKEILSKIDGHICPISELKEIADLKKIKSVYKLNDLKCKTNMLDIIVSRMVIKNLVSY